MTCQWVDYSRRERVARLLPIWLRYNRRLRLIIWKTNRCRALATTKDDNALYEGYRGLPVCDYHFKQVQLSNRIEEMIRRGEL